MLGQSDTHVRKEGRTFASMCACACASALQRTRHSVGTSSAFLLAHHDGTAAAQFVALHALCARMRVHEGDAWDHIATCAHGGGCMGSPRDVHAWGRMPGMT